MPPFAKTPYSSVEQWDAPLPIEQASVQLAEAVDRLGGRIGSRSDQRIEADFGSRLALRIFGIFQPSAATRLPMKVAIALDDRGSVTSVQVTMRSDEGWYLVRLPALESYYRSSFKSRAQALRDATSP